MTEEKWTRVVKQCIAGSRKVYSTLAPVLTAAGFNHQPPAVYAFKVSWGISTSPICLSISVPPGLNAYTVGSDLLVEMAVMAPTGDIIYNVKILGDEVLQFSKLDDVLSKIFSLRAAMPNGIVEDYGSDVETPELNS